MGRLVYAGILTVIIAFFCTVSGRAVYKDTNIMIDRIEEAEALVEAERYSEAAKKMEQCERAWVEYEDSLAPYVNHDELQEIGVSIATIIPFIEEEEKASALSQMANTKTLLIHKKDVNMFVWRDFV